LASNISYLWRTPKVATQFTNAVSLHGHTLYSREGLYFIPERAAKFPMLRWALAQQEKRCKKVRADFARAYWTPPLSARAAYEFERKQIENELQLGSMISLTDHDNIEAPVQLRLLSQTRHIPISLEWSVPFGNTEIHLGIHNLPSSSASRWLHCMQEYTQQPEDTHLGEILAGLADIRDLLIVLNHPMWDLCTVGKEAHRRSVESFLVHHNQFIHAFELGGLRSWEENQRVVDFADAWHRPVISGGDRHGCEPNAVLNLTNAKCFADFVQEIRSGHSNLVFMPQYQQSLVVRTMHTLVDVIRYIPDHPIGPKWDDRTFHPGPDGEMRPLSQIWKKTPAFIDAIFAGFRLVEAEPVKAVAKQFWGGSKNVFRVPSLEQGEEA
jgi:hypothetical protein